MYTDMHMCMGTIKQIAYIIIIIPKHAVHAPNCIRTKQFADHDK